MATTMMMEQAVERSHGVIRAHERKAFEVSVDLESEHNFYSGITGDISEGGVFVSTYYVPQIGECLEMELRLPNEEETFRVAGIVRWVRDLRAVNSDAPSGFGMEWTVLSPRALRAIQHFTRSRDSIYFEA